MAFKNLSEFVQQLRAENELIQIDEFVSTSLEITEITDRISKQPAHRNKALLFTNNGTDFPLLINALGSEKRICKALNCCNLDEHKTRIEQIFKSATSPKRTLSDKLSMIPLLKELQSWLPTHVKKAACQEVVCQNPDLRKLPILQCWKHDAGRFITFPMVITCNPETGVQNMGMYRMQVLDEKTTGMHWHKGKTGANHYEMYKCLQQRMPVSVALGGDPANIFSATAPLPENVDEQMLTGFLRRKSVQMVRCISNDLEVPADADFVIEGYIDPAEDLFMEGPFGDHTGFYSLPDLYPKFHVTCITHRKQAIYPATIVGIPPMEDAWIGKASERIFLAPIKLLFAPELIDYCMPFEGVSHNLVVAKIRKTAQGQMQKLTNAFWGAGQMANNKTLVVVDESCDIHNADEVWRAIQQNFNPAEVLIQSGMLDVLDHSGPNIGFGSKMAIDATRRSVPVNGEVRFVAVENVPQIEKFALAQQILCENSNLTCVILHDKTLKSDDKFSIIWHVLNNYHPKNDCKIVKNCLIIDGSSKLQTEQLRDLPMAVTSDSETISLVDSKWNAYGFGEFIQSPSLEYSKLFQHDSAWRYQ